MIGILIFLTTHVMASSGVDTTQFEGLKRNGFESHDTGWFGLSAEWAQRIYIGETEESVHVWMNRMQTQYYKAKLEPQEGNWDTALGNPELLLVKVGTVGLLCQGTNPTLCIEMLKSKIIEYDSPCTAPKAIMMDNKWALENSQSVNFDFKMVHQSTVKTLFTFQNCQQQSFSSIDLHKAGNLPFRIPRLIYQFTQTPWFLMLLIK